MLCSHCLRASDHPTRQPFCQNLSPQGMRKIRDRSARPCHGPDRSDPARAPHRLACSRARPHARCLRSEPARPLTTAHSHPPTEASRAADGARERSTLRVDPQGWLVARAAVPRRRLPPFPPAPVPPVRRISHLNSTDITSPFRPVAMEGIRRACECALPFAY